MSNKEKADDVGEIKFRRSEVEAKCLCRSYMVMYRWEDLSFVSFQAFSDSGICDNAISNRFKVGHCR